MSIEQIDNCDYYILQDWISVYLERKRKEKIDEKISKAESALIAAASCMRDKHGKPMMKIFEKWHKKQIELMFPEEKKISIFEYQRKLKKSIKG